jgi:hypothetical protein
MRCSDHGEKVGAYDLFCMCVVACSSYVFWRPCFFGTRVYSAVSYVTTQSIRIWDILEAVDSTKEIKTVGAGMPVDILPTTAKLYKGETRVRMADGSGWCTLIRPDGQRPIKPRGTTISVLLCGGEVVVVVLTPSCCVRPKVERTAFSVISCFFHITLVL